MSTYDVRIHGILTNKNAAKATYTVRWVVAKARFRDTFATKALAESFRSKLLIAQREGVAFDESSGLPEPMAREQNTRTWLEHAMQFADMKWPRASANHRRSIAEALTTVTPALLTTDQGKPDSSAVRRVLYHWVFNKNHREKGELPEDDRITLKWLESHTLRLPQVADPAVIRKALDTIALKLDGKPAAPTTIARKRAVFYSSLKYAVELQLLLGHPMEAVSWTAPKANDEIDRRSVVNPEQARALLGGVAERAPRLTAFFGCMYYSALRPEEVIRLQEDAYERPKKAGEWGWFHLSGATATSGEAWTDEDGIFEERGLKHRARTATRRVPIPPELVALLDDHIREYRPPRNGRLFRSNDGSPVRNSTYCRIWRETRKEVFTEAQAASPLAKVPYQLRHAAVSLWLNAGVPAPQVAEWAGHSVHVLMKVYAKCLDNQEDAARRRIEAALAAPERRHVSDTTSESQP